jgi:hypothetical protein
MQGQLQTPFNIGQEIALAGFQIDECESLMQGLAAKSSNPQALMQAVLTWTGGQPFLTQKVCKLVLNENSMVPDGEEESWVADLVRAKVIENWETQDTPEHLKTIRDRVLYSGDEKGRGRLLGLYQQVLGDPPQPPLLKGGEDSSLALSVQGGEEQPPFARGVGGIASGILVDDSYEQMQLRLTGLVVKRDRRLVVYNPIYAAVFNQQWVAQALSDLRPAFYGSAFLAWRESGEQQVSFLLRGQALVDAEAWAKGKRLSDEDDRFLSDSREVEKIENNLKLEAEQQAREVAEKERLIAVRQQEIAEEEARILGDAKQKADRRVKVGSAILAVTLAMATGAGLWAARSVNEADASKRIANDTKVKAESESVFEKFVGVKKEQKKLPKV